MPSHENPTDARPPRRRLRRRVAILALPLTAVAAVLLVYRHYTSPQRVCALAERYLQRYVNGDVTISRASFSWLDGIRLIDVAIGEARAAGRTDSQNKDPAKSPVADRPVFSCREVQLTLNPLSALTGNLRIRSIRAREPTCRIARYTSDGHSNLRDLFRPVPATESIPDDFWPVIELANARVEVVSRELHGDRPIEDLRVTARAVPSKPHPRSYDIVWQDDTVPSASGHSRIDLRTGHLKNMDGGLPWMSVEAVMLVLDAGYDGAGAWSALLGLDGTIRAQDYRFEPSGHAATHEAPGGVDPLSMAPAAHRWVLIELNDALLSIPITNAEHNLPADQRYLRFENVEGTARLTDRGIQARFAGSFHGSDCDVTLSLKGDVGSLATLDDVEFSTNLTVRNLRLPDAGERGTAAETRFVQRWKRLAGIYRDYDPAGLVDLEITAEKRAGPGEPVRVKRLFLDVKNAEGSYRIVPYRLREIQGQVEYTPEGVWIRELRGRHAAGTVSINAWLDRPKRWAEKKVTVTATDVTIDDDLYAALPQRYRGVCRRFDPHGSVDLSLELHQPKSEPPTRAPWETDVTVALRNVSACYESFPYPLDGLTGRVRIAGPRIEVIDVAGRHGEARVEVTGTAGVAGRTLRELALSVRGHGVALDQALLGALPQRTRHVVAAFDPAGRIDIDSSVTLVADDPHPRVVSDVTLVDVSARYAGFPLGLTRIMGRLRMTPEEVIVDGVTGRWKESTFSMTGSVDLADDGGAAALTIRSRDLRLGPELRDCLPGPLRTALADWQVDGPLELETTLQADIMDTSKAPRHHTTLRLAGTTVRHAAFPKPFTDVHAEVAIGPRRASATGVSLRFGPAVVNADFEVPYAGTEDAATVRLTARGLPLGGAIRPLWPKHVRDLLDSLRPAGSVDLYLSELRFARGEPDGPRQWTVSGYAELSDVSLGAVDLAGVRGTIAGSGTLFGPAGGTSLTGQIALSGLDLLGQHLTRADARWSLARVAGGEGMLLMESIQAGIYGGTTSGRLEVSFDREGTKYDVSAMVRAMQLQPFVNAARMARGPGDDPIDVAGSTGAQFYLSGVVGDPRSRRGGGSFEITHGRMYRLPIILAIFKLLNLSGINDEAFHEAAAEFFIMGQRVRLDNIRLTGDALSLIGSGSMSLADGGVDLGLVNVTPHRWARIPLITDLVEGASRELVELRVTGPMARPIVRARPLSGVTDEFKRLFKRQRGSPSSAVRADRP